MRGRVFGFALVVALAPAVVRADSTVTVTLTPQGQALAQALGANEAELIQHVTDSVNALYQLQNPNALLDAVGKAAAAANRGLGVDYATQAGELVFGAVAQGAFAGGPEFGNAKVAAGDLVNLGLFAGASLVRWGLPRLAVFVNGYYETATVDQLTGHLTTLGAHVQWRAIDARATGAVQWIGLDVTTGVEYAREEVGAENFFLFGLNAREVYELKSAGYHPMDSYDGNPELREAIDLIGSGFFSQGDQKLFKPIVDSLLYYDEYLVLADYQAYVDCQEEVNRAFGDRDRWTRMAILNVARMGKFSSDRAIREYCERIWHVEPGALL